MSTRLSWKLFVAAQFRRRERAHAQDLVNFPFEEIEGTESRCGIWITGRDFLGMLLFHPNQMLVQTHRPFFPGLYRSPKNQIPHHYLLCFASLSREFDPEFIAGSS
jgi:hypothetical protein